MFDIGMSEMLIIGVVALIAIGPKELPGALKTFAYWMRQARKLAREFQSGVDDLVRQAELDEAKKAVEDAHRNITQEIEKSVDPTGEMKQAFADDPTRVATPTPSIPAAPSAPAAVSQAPAASDAAAAPSEPAQPSPQVQSSEALQKTG
jgi:sec-independent protein translocase protein TatB